MSSMQSVLRPFFLHPALSFAGDHAVVVHHRQGFSTLGRKWSVMSAQAATLGRPFSARMIARVMRNVIVGLVLFLIVGNLGIFLAFKTMAQTGAAQPLPALPSIENLHSVDERLWRGSAPDRSGYAALADQGVKTIIDLRAEDLHVDEGYLNSLGMDLVRLPMRDGQAPSDEQVDAFLAAVRDSDGLAFVHCGAGVGRTGTMAAAYLVSTGQASPLEATARNLAVGPPSLEQIAFASSLEMGEEPGTNPVITGLSRVLDAPRRMLVRIRSSYGS